MIALSYFVPFLGFVNVLKERKKMNLVLQYLLAFFVNILCIFLVFLWIRKAFPWNNFVILGHVPFCNKNPERALHMDGIVFPLCYRCMSFVFGAYLMILFILSNGPKIKRRNILMAIISIFPCLVDGIFQTFTSYESNNFKRFTFGLICGLGVGYLLYAGILYIFHIHKVEMGTIL